MYGIEDLVDELTTSIYLLRWGELFQFDRPGQHAIYNPLTRRISRPVKATNWASGEVLPISARDVLTAMVASSLRKSAARLIWLEPGPMVKHGFVRILSRSAVRRMSAWRRLEEQARKSGLIVTLCAEGFTSDWVAYLTTGDWVPTETMASLIEGLIQLAGLGRPDLSSTYVGWPDLGLPWLDAGLLPGQAGFSMLGVYGQEVRLCKHDAIEQNVRWVADVLFGLRANSVEAVMSAERGTSVLRNRLSDPALLLAALAELLAPGTTVLPAPWTRRAI